MIMQLVRLFQLIISFLVWLSSLTVYADTGVIDTLYLSVSVNNSPVDNLIRIKKEGSKYSILAEDADKLKINIDNFPRENKYIILIPGRGFNFKYNELEQTFNIIVGESYLTRKQRLNDPYVGKYIHEDEISEPINGVALNYNLFFSHDNDNKYISGYSELKTFDVGYGALSTSFNTRLMKNNIAAGNTGTRRLMTSWNWENVDKILSLTVGDSYTATQDWTNSMRFGGLSLSHSYKMQPEINTSTRDILTDTVTMPSTVDLYVQGVKHSSSNVEPGQFTLNTAPVLSGTGSAKVVITDINGQQRVVNLPIYGTNQLLSPGLTTWSLNGGWIREDYSEKSFSYNPEFVFIGNIRNGISNSLTLESHFEKSKYLNNFGIGGKYLISPVFGVVHGNLSWGKYHHNNGVQWGAGWNWNNRILNLSINHTQRSNDFRDVSYLENNTLITNENTAFIGVSLPEIGTIGSSWIDREYFSGNAKYVGLSWSKRIFKHLNLSASYTQSLADNKDKIFYMNINIPFTNNKNNFSIQYNYENSSHSEQINISQSLESNHPGWGWNISARHGDSDYGHFSVQRRNKWSDMEIGLNHFDNQQNYYTSVSGAVGLFSGNLHITRELGDSFAVVDTGDTPDIPVYLEHRPAGKTDKNGKLFLNNLLPYQNNYINVDVMHLGEEYRAPYTGQKIIPQRNGGALVKFNIYRTLGLLLTAHTRYGAVVPFSAKVTVLNSDGYKSKKGIKDTVVGYDGNIYLENPPSSGKVLVQWDSGQCTINLPSSLPGTGNVRKDVLCQ